jgi:hypothetical protein
MEYKTLDLVSEDGRKYQVTPTAIAQVLGKLERVIEYIGRGENDIALNFVKSALAAADEIIMEMVDDPDPDNFSGIKLEKIDYNSFWK